MSEYVLDEREAPRLEVQTELLDPFTFRRLRETGVGAGWRCLEVGGGTGSVANWLQNRVGSSGRVVTTDIQTQWLEPLAGPNLEVRRHDIVTDPVEPAGYDLVHVRLVLMHVPDPEPVLRKLVEALRPGGWLVVEDADWRSAAISYPRYDAWATVFSAVSAVLSVRGEVLDMGRRLPAELRLAGLCEVSAEGMTLPLPAHEMGRWVLPLIDRLREEIIGTGLIDPTELDEVVAELRDGWSLRWYFSPILVSARGRR